MKDVTVTVNERERKIEISEVDIKIIQGYADGEKSVDIAKELSMNIRTLESHVFRLRARLHCNSVTHLACDFLRQGLIK